MIAQIRHDAKYLQETPVPTQHPIHRALRWREQLDNDACLTRAQIAAREHLSRARVTQVMSLLGLPEYIQLFLQRLTDRRMILHFTERHLREIMQLAQPFEQRRAWEEMVRQCESGLPI